MFASLKKGALFSKSFLAKPVGAPFRFTVSPQRSFFEKVTAFSMPLNKRGSLEKSSLFAPFPMKTAGLLLHTQEKKKVVTSQIVQEQPSDPQIKWVAPPMPEDITYPVVNLANQKVGTIQLKYEVFKAPIRTDILHEYVVWQLAKRRQGTAKAKSRAEVRGGGRKPWKQKGTGRARAGSIRSPLWRGGGVTFPPRPRSYYYPLPKPVKRFALRSVLSAKLAQGKLIVVDNFELPTLKTKNLAAIVTGNNWNSCLIVDGVKQVNYNLSKAALALPTADVLPAAGFNVYSVLSRQVLVITKEAVESLQDRLVTKPKYPHVGDGLPTSTQTN